MRALLLDALGTLVRLEPPAPRLKLELADRLGIEVSEAEAGQAIKAEIAYYRAHLDEGADLDRLVALRRRCAEALRAALPDSAELAAAPPDALTDALVASLRFSAFADASPALVRARDRGLRVLVVSNWDVSLHGVLDQLGLVPLLDGILTSAEVGARKPSALIFERALEMVGALASEATHVGDSLDEDVTGARNAGVAPVLLWRDGRPGPPHVRTIATLADLA
jgi:putative hydrolase of the HAD superfamily